MFKLKESLFILLASAVLGYVVVFPVSSYEIWLRFSAIAFIILFINILAKKIIAHKLGCDIEIKPWNLERYGFDRASYLKWPIPAWLLWPVIVVWLSLGRVWWLVVTTFETYATTKRAGRKFAEVTEWDIALIAVAGIIVNLAAVIVASAFGYQQFAFIGLWFVFFNMLPFPAYDGGRIFFGGRLLWVFMFTFTLAILILLHIAANLLTIVIASLLTAIIAAFFFYSLRKRSL
jgi:Zn-dependent protease